MVKQSLACRPHNLMAVPLFPLKAALARLFKRGAGGDLSEDERSALCGLGVTDPEKQVWGIEFYMEAGIKTLVQSV